MRPYVKWFSTVMLAAFIIAPVFGQQPGVNVAALIQQGVDTPLLLATASVRKEIKLTDEQAQKFRAIAKEVRDNQPNIQKVIQETRDRINKAIPDILSKEQATRLQQIKLQVNGILPFTRTEVQEKLKLTAKQKTEIQDIADNLKKDIRKMFEGGSTPRERLAVIGKIPQLNQEAGRKAVAVLNDDQKKTWNEMIGDKFEVKLEMPRLGVPRP